MTDGDSQNWKNGSDQGSQIVVEKVTGCLASHEQCTGHYSDLSSKHLINCECRCHDEKQNRNKVEKVTQQYSCNSKKKSDVTLPSLANATQDNRRFQSWLYV